jgi:hypothetical protein
MVQSSKFKLILIYIAKISLNNPNLDLQSLDG